MEMANGNYPPRRERFVSLRYTHGACVALSKGGSGRIEGVSRSGGLDTCRQLRCHPTAVLEGAQKGGM